MRIALLAAVMFAAGCSEQHAKIVYINDDSRVFSTFDGTTTVQFDDGTVKQFKGILGTNGMWVKVRK